MLRNVRTLIAWHTAASAAMSVFKKDAPIPHICLIDFGDHSQEAIDDIKENGGAIVDTLKKKAHSYTTPEVSLDDLTRWLENNCTVPQPGETRPLRVHSEAGLMALLQESQVADTGIAVCGAPPTVEIA